MVPFYASSSSSTATNKAESSLRRHWQLRIASESHSSSGRFIPLFPNLDFCSIYQISSPSHNSILSYSVFSSVLNLSHFQLTFCFCFFCFLVFLFFLFFVFCFFVFFVFVLEDHCYCFLVKGSNATASICNLLY